MATSVTKPEPPLIVIVGPTASGKTGLAIRIAEEFGGEIISADSRAIYKGLDIGTAKPSIEERRGIPHWGLDLVGPGERFTVADFQYYAKQKIGDIRSRGRIPILVGGTGLYIDAVIYDFQFPALTNDTKRRREVETYTFEQLYMYCMHNNIKLPQNTKNKRHMINAVLRNGHALKRETTIDVNTTIVGITTEKSILCERIAQRTEQLFVPEMFEEARVAAVHYGWDSEALTGNIYPLLRQYFDGEIDQAQAKERCKTLDWQLARRQLTWLRRNQDIHWSTLDETYTYLAQLLAPLSK